MSIKKDTVNAITMSLGDKLSFKKALIYVWNIIYTNLIVHEKLNSDNFNHDNIINPLKNKLKKFFVTLNRIEVIDFES